MPCAARSTGRADLPPPCLILRRANVSRPSGSWSETDFDVFDGERGTAGDVGRIFQQADVAWFWGVSFSAHRAQELRARRSSKGLPSANRCRKVLDSREVIMRRMIFSVAGVALLASTLASFDCARGDDENGLQTEPSGAAAGPNSMKFSLQHVIEAVAKNRGNRAKYLRLSDAYNIPCPQVAALMYASGGGIGIIIPNFEMNGAALFQEEKNGDPNAVMFALATATCRFSIALKKFALRDGVPSEIALSSPLAVHTRFAAPTSKQSPTPGPSPSMSGVTKKSTPIVTVNGNKITLDMKGIDPELVGTTELYREFASSDPALTFSGMAWFGPKNFSFYFGNAADDLSIEARRNAAEMALEVDLTNAKARMRLSIKKDVLVENSWVTEFGE
jgi:hypothetical protein